MKHMDNPKLFDQKIREAINKYDVPFDDTAWKNIENKINVKPNSPFTNWKIGIISATVAAAIVIAYFAYDQGNNATVNPLQENAIEISPIESSSEMDENVVNQEDQNNFEIEDQPSEVILPLVKKEKKKNTPVIEKDSNAPKESKEGFASESKVLQNANTEVKELNIIQKEENTEKLSIGIHINSQTICLNEMLMLSLASSNEPVEVHWDFGDGNSAEGPTAVHVYKESGNYVLSLSAKSVLNDDRIQNESYTIQVNSAPFAQFDMKMGDNMLAYPNLTFHSESENATSLEWIFNDERIENKDVVEKIFTKKGSYSVGLIVFNQFQCSDTAFTHFNIENDYNLLAPNAFSPNGDGINDTFIPQAIPYLNQGFTMKIFDPKSGQMIFETSNFELPWNGRFMNNGNNMNEGAYAWSVITEDGSVYKGTILITGK